MKRKSRLILTITAATACVALIGGELAARSAIDNRLNRANADIAELRFAGDSGLISLVTRSVPVTATLSGEQVASRLGDRVVDRLGEASSVTLTDGALGIETHGKSGKRKRPVTAWITLDQRDGAITATVISVEVAGLQLDPSALMGGDFEFSVPNPLASRCSDPPEIDDIRITEDGVDITMTVTDSTMDCLRKEEQA